MLPSQLYFIAGLTAACCAPFVAHLILTRVFKRYAAEDERQSGCLAGCAFGVPAAVAVFFAGRSLFPGGDPFSLAVYITLVYGLAAYTYFHFFNISETSRRIRLLTLLSRGGMDGRELAARYDPWGALGRRLGRLSGLGELKEREGRFSLARRRLLVCARAVFILRSVLFPLERTDWKPLAVLVLAAAGAGVCNSGIFPFPASVVFLLSVVICAVSLVLLDRRDGASNFLLAAAPVVIVFSCFLFSPYLPSGDIDFHVPMFSYMAEHFSAGRVCPWIASAGGIRTGFVHISDFLTVPHRLTGYFLYTMTGMGAEFAYRLQFILGVLFIGFGWWLVLKKLTGSRYAAFFGALMVMLGGNGMTFHQEQALATQYLAPWFVLSLMKVRDDRSFILPAAAIAGLGLSTHQPQLQMIAMVLTGVVFAAVSPATVRAAWRVRWFGAAAVCLIVLAALPSAYLLHHLPSLVSPMREMDDLLACTTLQQYDVLTGQQIASAPRRYLEQYFMPRFGAESGADCCAFFVGRPALVMAAAGVALNFRAALVPVFLAACFMVLTLGLNSPGMVPRALFLAGVPYINVFRQWYHFFPLLNFCLSAAAAIGVAAAAARISRAAGGRRTVAAGCLALAMLLNFVDLAHYALSYTSVFAANNRYVPPAVNGPLLLAGPDGPTELFIYRSRGRAPVPDELWPVALISLVDRAVVPGDGGMLPLGVEGAAGITRSFDAAVTAEGLSCSVEIPGPRLLVTPLNYDLRLKAFVDGSPVPVHRVNGFLAGVELEKQGRHAVKFALAEDGYNFILTVQYLMYVFVAVFLLAKYLEGRHADGV